MAVTEELRIAEIPDVEVDRYLNLIINPKES